MKKFYLVTIIACCLLGNAKAQINWQTDPNIPGSSVWSTDTMNGKLYISFGWIYEYDGTTWTVLNNYNNSSNTGNKTKSALKCINGKIYAGAKDFNTSGEGAMHYYDAGNWYNMQSTDFTYHGNYKFRRIIEYQNEIYACGNFKVPTDENYFDLAKWNGTDWVNLGKNFLNGNSEVVAEISDMDVFQNKLYITNGSNVYSFDGTSWDSLFNGYNNPPVFPIGGVIQSMVELNNNLYISGSFALSMAEQSVLLVKYNGTTFSSVARGEGLTSINLSNYSNIGRLFLIKNKIYFPAKRIDDSHTYLVSYDGTNLTQIGKLASNGDYTFAPGSEYLTYSNMFEYKGQFYISGNFQKIGGQAVTGLVYSNDAILLSVKDEQNNILASVYPNPGNGEIQLKINNQHAYNLKITDLRGSCIFIKNDITNSIIVNTGLNPGIYFYQLIDSKNKEMTTGKLIVTD